jgi:hypothetical protein
LDRAEPQTLQAFVKRHDIRYPVGVDVKHEAAIKYGVRGTPTSFLISPQGTLLGGAQGPRPWDSQATLNLFKHLLSDAS